MHIRSLYYFTETTKDLNITKTAARLFISQQTLSNHIQRLENELGVELLRRRPSLALTTAGERFLDFALTVAREHTNLTDMLGDIEKQERGSLRIGASVARGSTLLPEILPVFSKRYPNIEIRFTGAVSAELRAMILKHELDFAVVLGADHTPKLVTHHLLDEHIYLCVSERLLRNMYPDEAKALKEKSFAGARIQDFARLPVALYTNHLGDRIQRCYDEAGITPNTFLTGTYRYISASLCAQGLCAIFLTQMSLMDRMISLGKDINIFPMVYNNSPMVQPIALIHRKDRYLTRYATFCIEAVRDYFATLAPIDLARTAS